tara:strand:+ start:322 stop:570 length:249 start_codon:yes stop_codon:yes gene_type:complete
MTDNSDAQMLEMAKVVGLLTKLTAGLTLQMWQDGNLPAENSSDFAEILKNLARLYEAGDEKVASELWTAANLIQRPAPKEEE